MKRNTALVVAALILGAVCGPALAQTEIKVSALDGAEGDQFGVSVAIAGNTAVVGASGGNSAYIFSRDHGGIEDKRTCLLGRGQRADRAPCYREALRRAVRAYREAANRPACPA